MSSQAKLPAHLRENRRTREKQSFRAHIYSPTSNLFDSAHVSRFAFLCFFSVFSDQLSEKRGLSNIVYLSTGRALYILLRVRPPMVRTSAGKEERNSPLTAIVEVFPVSYQITQEGNEGPTASMHLNFWSIQVKIT